VSWIKEAVGLPTRVIRNHGRLTGKYAPEEFDSGQHEQGQVRECSLS
jgi:hypothetical protein